MSANLSLAITADLHWGHRRGQEASRELITLPTGDGMALVFFRDPVAPVNCSIELVRVDTNVKQRSCLVASSSISNSTRSPADDMNCTPSRFATTILATASCAVRTSASFGAVSASTSPVTVTTRASVPCSATCRFRISAGNALFMFRTI